MNQDHSTWAAFLQTLPAYLTALGTLAIAVVAVWGDYLRHKFAGPKLSIELRNPRGDLNRTIAGTKLIHYHLRVMNKRKWSVAKNCRVLLKQISRQGPDGNFQPIPFNVPRQFIWAPAESTPSLIDLSGEHLLDFGLISEAEGQLFQPTLYSYPNNFQGSVGANEAVKYSLEVVADGFNSKEYHVFEVAWKGKWSDNLDDMARNLVVKPA